MECTRMLVLVMLTCFLMIVQSHETRTVKYCGKNLAQILAMVCRRFPGWDDQKTTALTGDMKNRVRRQQEEDGIATECCNNGCSWEQLTSYCAPGEQIEGSFSSILDSVGLSHYIEDRSVESAAELESIPESEFQSGAAFKKLFGATEVRRSKCWCRRKRRAGRRKGSRLTGKMVGTGYVIRSAPIVGTVSPLLNWGRTIRGQTDQFAYVTV